MPDWLAHILTAWIICRLLSLRFKTFDSRATSIVMIGSLLPDLMKFGHLFELINIDAWALLTPLHTPVDVILTAGMVTLLFEDRSKIFSLFLLGASTHFALDFLLIHLAEEGTPLLFPFSWSTYELDLIASDSFLPAIITLILVSVIFIIDKYVMAKRKALKKMEEM